MKAKRKNSKVDYNLLADILPAMPATVPARKPRRSRAKFLFEGTFPSGTTMSFYGTKRECMHEIDTEPERFVTARVIRMVDNKDTVLKAVFNSHLEAPPKPKGDPLPNSIMKHLTFNPWSPGK